MSWREAAELKKEQNAQTRAQHGMLRRFTLKLSRGRLWQILGHLIDGVRENFDSEPFQGIGFWSSPAKGERAEVIVANLGGDAGHPVIIATRNEDVRKLYDSQLAQGSTAMFNNATIIIINPDGTVEVRSRNGVAAPLATKADLAALKSAISGAGTVPNDGGSAFKAALLAALSSWPVGTTKLKAE